MQMRSITWNTYPKDKFAFSSSVQRSLSKVIYEFLFGVIKTVQTQRRALGKTRLGLLKKSYLDFSTYVVHVIPITKRWISGIEHLQNKIDKWRRKEHLKDISNTSNILGEIYQR
ncbi:hypothetical protein CDAR_488661 [Caerostris darwini]|uniref:Uncharacterized protein n=1 Tax=Caerostris darwini TaxID=1538125 RepID=A0AAV4S7H5_9ARAC|nr:hypothetical protein CDAR_488661 [Caerostris darwini]